MSTDSIRNRGLSLKTLSVIFLIVAFFALIDVAISSLVDVYKDFSISPAGISLFLVVTAVLFAGTYVILKITGNEIKGQTKRRAYGYSITKVVWIIYYLMVAIVVFVILQLLLFSEYYTGLLSIAPTISYGLAAFIMGSLAYYFFSWFLRSKDLVVLLYGLASVSASVYVVLVAIIFYVEIFTYQQAVTTLESSASFSPIEPGFDEMLTSTLPGILTATTFLFIWGGTIAILYANIRRIGKTSFWILVTTPIIFFLGTLFTLFPEMQGTLEDDPNSLIIAVYITTFSQIAAVALFSTAFFTMARAISYHQVSNYMYITCYGLTLFSIGIMATVSGAGYPPFGLPVVSLVGPFSFLFFIGLNHSAISIAEDSSKLQNQMPKA